ncbi:MAG: site-2 protease family protein [Rhodocyclaceae bacterium]
MKELLVTLAVFALLFALMPVIQGVRAFFALMRCALWQPVIQRLESEPELAPFQQAAKAEIEDMGFVCVASFAMQCGADQHFQFMFRHESRRTHAWLNMTPYPYSGYPVAFYSFLPDGRRLLTQNRIAWAMPNLPSPDMLADDPLTDSVLTQWAVHESRIAGTALETVNDEDVIDRILAGMDTIMPTGVVQGLLTPKGSGFGITAKGALRMTLSLLRVGPKINRPFHAAVFSGEFRAPFFAALHDYHKSLQAQRHAQAPAARIALPVISAMAFLGLWAMAFDWQSALMLAGVIAVHEAGHAIVMWYFGHRDLNVFFIPFLGAVVTAAERPLPVWQRALIYFAGPLPGLLAGLAILVWGAHQADMENLAVWMKLAHIGIWVNLFNLLPITPLDGGRLLEISLLGRRPRVRFGFAVASLLGFMALAVWAESSALWFAIALLGINVRNQWQLLGIQQKPAEPEGTGGETEQLYRGADAVTGGKSFAHMLALVKQTEAHKEAVPARRWEMLGTPLLLVLIWAGSLTLLAPEISSWRHGEDLLDAPQAAFDKAYESFYEDGESDGAKPSLSRKERLLRLAQQLPAQDPRWIDMHWLEAQEGDGEARIIRMRQIIRLNQEGHHVSRKSMVSQFLEQVHAESLREAPAKRASRLQNAVDEVLGSAPELYSSTINAQLRVAEEMDRSGDMTGAEERIRSIRKIAESKEDCKCAVPNIYRAYAWFMMKYKRHAEALSLLENSPYTDRFKKANDSFGEARAWALLMNGRNEDGLGQMRISVYSEPYTPTPEQKARGVGTYPPTLVEAGSLIFALRSNGREDEARTLLSDMHSEWVCRRREYLEENWISPWEDLRDKWASEALTAVCPPQPQRNAETAGS